MNSISANKNILLCNSAENQSYPLKNSYKMNKDSLQQTIDDLKKIHDENASKIKELEKN